MSIRTLITAALLYAMLAVTTDVWAQDDENVVKVMPGDSLFAIVRLHYPDKPSRWSLIENEIFIANPHAFSDNNRSLLRVGALLDMPVYESPGEGLTNLEAPETPPAPVPHSLATVGSVMELSGTPYAIDINNETRILELNGNVYRGDAILTEGDSAAHLLMNDGAQLYVRARSRIVLDDYTFFENSPRSSRSIITLLKGGFRAITGLIGRHNPAAVRIGTAVATIGVRGTDFAVRICRPDECSLPDVGTFEAGDYAGVLGGEITITNSAGTMPVPFGEIVRTATPDSAPVPAPEAAALIFTESELALLESKKQKPMNFFQWLHSKIFRKSPE